MEKYIEFYFKIHLFFILFTYFNFNYLHFIKS